MNTFMGPFRLMMKEMCVTFYINAIITCVLFAFFAVLALSDVIDSVSFILFGPLFIVFLMYPFVNFKAYDYILSFGGTRKQFVMALYLSAFLFSAASAVLLNALYFLSTRIAGPSMALFHLGRLTNHSSWLVSVWVDFSWLSFLFALGMIAKTFWFNYGKIISLSLATLLLIASILIVTFGNLSWLIELFFLHHLQFVSILFVIALVFLLLAYLLMRDAPLENGSRLNLSRQ